MFYSISYLRCSKTITGLKSTFYSKIQLWEKLFNSFHSQQSILSINGFHMLPFNLINHTNYMVIKHRRPHLWAIITNGFIEHVVHNYSRPFSLSLQTRYTIDSMLHLTANDGHYQRLKGVSTPTTSSYTSSTTLNWSPSIRNLHVSKSANTKTEMISVHKNLEESSHMLLQCTQLISALTFLTNNMLEEWPRRLFCLFVDNT